MEEKKTAEELREELHSVIDSMTPEQEDRLLRSWEATVDLNRKHPRKSGYYLTLVQ